MARLSFDQVTVKFPIYNNRGLSLRNQLVRIATGGRIETEAGHVTMVTALRDVSFDLRDGESIGLIGHNGSGKTTMLRTMAGIYLPTSGSVVRQGRTATIFEIGAGMEPELTGRENIVRMGVMLGLEPAEARMNIPDIVEFTELGDFIDLPVRTYSSGMTMRLMFAIATSTKPEILLIDEMFSTGDESFRNKAENRMKSLLNIARIVVFASHSPDLVRRFCKRVYRLEHGILLDEGAIDRGGAF